jgi:cytochrome c-type biogenesis protein CcmH
MQRREFLLRAALGGAGLLVSTRALAQDSTATAPAPGQSGSGNLFGMDQAAAKTVRRPPKPGARPQLSAEDRDALEHQIRCQCGCTLDVYTCRTTDFSCQVSPEMHRDVISLVEGGYSAPEILDAFVDTYGERALMAPKKEGFNLAGYLVPFAALGAGAVAVVTVLRGMQRRTAAVAHPAAPSPDVAATDDERARLEAAIKRDV